MLPSGSTTSYAYDALMRLTGIDAKDPGQNTVLTRNLLYAPNGNILSKHTEHGLYEYTYDDLSRLLTANNPTLPDESYTYDALGNRKTDSRVEGTWSHNPNNQLTGFGNVSFSYDENGNMSERKIADHTTRYIYDVEDRLIKEKIGVRPINLKYYPFPTDILFETQKD